MAGTLERDETATRGLVERVESVMFERAPLSVVALLVVAVSVLIHGYSYSLSATDVALVASDPWYVQRAVDAPWTYSSPLGPILAWAAGMDEWGQLQAFHFVMTIACVLICTYAVAHFVSELAGRLWAFAFFCSPNSWASVALLGLFDIFTVAAVTIMFVGTPTIALAAGMVGGLAHFEQAAVAAVGVSVFRLWVRRESWQPVAAMWAGLLLGKLVVWIYVTDLGVESSSRLQFVRDQGVGSLFDAWRGHVPIYLWAVFNVLWIGVVWMLVDMERRERLITIGVFAALTVPVMLTLDIGRVYRNVTWPVVMMLVVYAAGHPNRTLVRRAALVLIVAACFVPRTEIWQGGVEPWITH